MSIRGVHTALPSMRHSCRRVPGWTSTSTFMSSVYRFLKWCTWVWTPQCLSCNQLTSLHCIGCHVARNPVLGVKTGGVGFSSLSWVSGPAELFCLEGERPQLRLGSWQSDNATLDLVAATMHSSGLEAEDFVPAHVERLSRRLAFGMDGISLDYMFMEAERNSCADAGPFLRSWEQWNQRWSSFPSAWRAKRLVSRSARDARPTGATSAEEAWSFAVCVAPGTRNPTVTKMSTPATYEGRGTALPPGYKSLGKARLVASALFQGVTLDHASLHHLGRVTIPPECLCQVGGWGH